MTRSSLLLVLGFVGALLAAPLMAQPVLEVRETNTSGTVIAHNDAAAGVRAFGSVAVAGGSGVATIVILNTGTTDLTPGTPSVTSGGADFSVNTAGFTSPVAASGNTSFTITFDPATVGAKTGTIEFTHDDGTVTSPFIINVSGTGTNTDPVLGAPSSGGITIGGSDPNFTGSIAVGGNLAVSFTATDADTADTLSFTISVTGGSLTGVQAGFAETFPFSPAGGTTPEIANLTGTAANVGTITLTISVSDGTTTDQYNLAITINAANNAPVLGAPSSGGITIGGSDPNFTGAITVSGNLAVSFTATDADAGDTLTFTISVTGGSLTGAQAGFAETFPFSPAGGTSPETANLTGTAANAGTITLTISVSDGTVTDQYTLAITINAGNSPPVLATPTWPGVTVGGSDPNFTASIVFGQNLNASFLASDANGGDTLTTTVTVTGGTLSAAGAGFTGFTGATRTDSSPGVSPHNITLAGNAAASGTITLQVSVSDGTDTDVYSLAITITNPTVNVTAPNGGEVLNVSSSFNITWTNGGGFTGNVDISLSTDGGSSFPNAVATNIPNTGTFAWTVPNLPSTTCRVRVQGNGGSAPPDDSAANFTITTGGSPSVTVTSPNGGETLVVGVGFNITWTNGGGFGATVNIDLSTDGGATFPISISTGIANTGSRFWTVTNNPSTTCRIRVSGSSGGTPSDVSNSNFTIALPSPQTINIMDPNGGEALIVNSGFLVTWSNGGGFSGNVDVLLSVDNGVNYTTTLASNVSNLGYVSINVPNMPTNLGRIRVRAAGSGNPLDDSDSTFQIILGTLGGAVGNAGGADGAHSVTPGKSTDGLHFSVANNAQSPTAFTITSMSVAIDTNDNTSNLAKTHLAGVRLQRSNGSTIETVLNGGAGWNESGATITVSFGGTTPLSINIAIGTSEDFWIELFFTSVAVVGVPDPTFACSIDNTAGTALNGGGTLNYPGVVAGGSITLVSSIPGDDFFDDDNNGDCTTSESSSGTLWMLALLSVLLGALALRRRLRGETSL